MQNNVEINKLAIGKSKKNRGLAVTDLKKKFSGLVIGGLRKTPLEFETLIYI